MTVDVEDAVAVLLVHDMRVPDFFEHRFGHGSPG
jgi:hypothetical protein